MNYRFWSVSQSVISNVDRSSLLFGYYICFMFVRPKTLKFSECRQSTYIQLASHAPPLPTPLTTPLPFPLPYLLHHFLLLPSQLSSTSSSTLPLPLAFPTLLSISNFLHFPFSPFPTLLIPFLPFRPCQFTPPIQLPIFFSSIPHLHPLEFFY